jgi:hypothetical protein
MSRDVRTLLLFAVVEGVTITGGLLLLETQPFHGVLVLALAGLLGTVMLSAIVHRVRHELRVRRSRLERERTQPLAGGGEQSASASTKRVDATSHGQAARPRPSAER